MSRMIFKQDWPTLQGAKKSALLKCRKAQALQCVDTFAHAVRRTRLAILTKGRIKQRLDVIRSRAV